MKRRNFLKLIAVSPAIPSVLCARGKVRANRDFHLIDPTSHFCEETAKVLPSLMRNREDETILGMFE